MEDNDWKVVLDQLYNNSKCLDEICIIKIKGTKKENSYTQNELYDVIKGNEKLSKLLNDIEVEIIGLFVDDKKEQSTMECILEVKLEIK